MSTAHPASPRPEGRASVVEIRRVAAASATRSPRDGVPRLDQIQDDPEAFGAGCGGSSTPAAAEPPLTRLGVRAT